MFLGVLDFGLWGVVEGLLCLWVLLVFVVLVLVLFSVVDLGEFEWWVVL